MIDRQRVIDYFVTGDTAATSKEKGDALVGLVVYLFTLIPGVSLSAQNIWDPAKAEEIDIAFWNDEQDDGLRQFPAIVLVECKNWHEPTGNIELVYFIHKLRERGRDFGIYVASNGITGDATRLNMSHQALRSALASRCEVVVLTRNELLDLGTSDDLILLLKKKRAALAASGTCL